MITTNVYTITDLLYTPAIKCNQTTLAKLLNISRGTLRKYMDDTTNERHSIVLVAGKYRFHCNASARPTGVKNHAYNAHANMA